MFAGEWDTEEKELPNKRMIIRRLLGAPRLTTSGCSSQSRRQASLPPVSLLIRSIRRLRDTHLGEGLEIVI
jgi:hypothetical protein